MVIAAVEPSGAVLMVTVSPLRIALMGAVRVSCTVVDWFVVNVFYAAAPGYDATAPLTPLEAVTLLLKAPLLAGAGTTVS